MKKLYTLKDLEAMHARGESLAALPEGTQLTPMARDFLRAQQRGRKGPASAATPATPPEPIVPDYEYRWTPGRDPRTPAEIQAFFTSPPIEELKRRMCAMGERMWQKGYTDGNGGNLTLRVGDNLVLCTPTLVSKGFMTPEMMSLVDMEGKQLAGKFKRTSECMTHLGIMKRQPAAKACCHAHPPHGTAYAVAKVAPPTCLIPEAEVFLGVIGRAEYKTPGTPENADAVGEAAVDHQAVLMENHGVITWGKDIEDAYWKMENVDAYCQTVLLASMLGKELTPILPKQAKELIALRKTLGMSDYREDWKECELCDVSEFRPGFAGQVSTCALPEKAKTPSSDCGCSASGASVLPDPEAEKIVQAITERLWKQTQAQS
ncbi:MAG: class II aldolase/adducin family protein [Opitutales bacterium]